ncbi:PTS sugar transporter subunit IIA [Spiroplasma sp. SV19]|uniref:PTS sugar transporter subunit IIA n=1 Tax=Spiroplasma sp. SV19 TaxID=2570468 RepID=UPI0024B84D24|nr:PTS sugar transporter subunit IIA [Spiroplasma sp. SV19]WHQ37245.1 PTS sugar transporter subunit IIA [Spiroplasma sp. SV19]
MNQKLFNINHIYLNVASTTKKDAFNFIAASFVENDVSLNFKKCYKGLIHREKEGSTGFNDGIAIPHAKVKEIIQPGIFVYQFAEPIAWNSIDGSKVKVAIGLAIPDVSSGVEHIKMLSSVARKLIDDDFRKNLFNATTKEAILTLVNEIEII